jgi:hypothetical protein
MPRKLTNNRAGLMGMQFCFANLCGSFALFAVSVFVLPQRTQRTRKEPQSQEGSNPATLHQNLPLFSAENEQMARLTINQRVFTLKLLSKNFYTSFA